MSFLTESVTHPERVQKVADLQQAYYRWESNLKEFQRGRPTGLDDDVKANAMRHMMPKEILDTVNLQPQYRTFVEIRDYMLHKARQGNELMCLSGMRYRRQRKLSQLHHV